VARSQPPNEHENPLTGDDAAGKSRRPAGESGQVRPRTAGLLAAGFAIGAITIGTMSLTLSPDAPPPVKPVQLGGPDERDRSRDENPGRKRREGDGARRRPAGQGDRRARRMAAPREDTAPASPPAGGRQSAPPPTASPRRPARPGPAPQPQPQPQPQEPQPQPQPQPQPPPPADDDGGGGDGDVNDGDDHDAGDLEGGG
jgi:hypothetical protein